MMLMNGGGLVKQLGLRAAGAAVSTRISRAAIGRSIRQEASTSIHHRSPQQHSYYSTTGAAGNNSNGGSSSATTNNDAMNLMSEHMQHLKLKDSLEPIPYSNDLPFTPLNDDDRTLGHKKVTVVGCGQVGMAIGYALLNQTTAGTLALVDKNEAKLLGEAKDLQQGSGFHDNVRIVAGTSYEVSAHSHLVIVTAGVAQKPGESRLKLIERNTAIMKNIIPQVLAHSPDAAICIVSNPCDIMTAVANKVAGPSIPAGRIFGSGTCLDSSRLQSLLAKTLDIDAQSVSGYVVGEHGDASVALWSSVRVGGVPMLKPGEAPSAVHAAMHRQVIDSAYDVIQRKGYTNWAVGLTGAYIGKAVLNDERKIMTVSTCVRGIHGITEDVYLSIPCSLGSHGVRRLVNVPMTPYEVEGFQHAAEAIWNVQKGVWDSL